MLQNFEEYTEDLNDKEQAFCGVIAAMFETNEDPVTARRLVLFFREKQEFYGLYCDIRIDESRIRKFINFICRRLLPNLIGTSKGYFVTNDVEQLKRAASTLRSRANENNRRADAIIDHLKSTYGLHEKS